MLKKKNNTIDLTFEDFSFILTAVSAKVHEIDKDYLYVDGLHPDSDDFQLIVNDWIYANNIYRKLLTAFAKNENKKVKVIFK